MLLASSKTPRDFENFLGTVRRSQFERAGHKAPDSLQAWIEHMEKQQTDIDGLALQCLSEKIGLLCVMRFRKDNGLTSGERGRFPPNLRLLLCKSSVRRSTVHPQSGFRKIHPRTSPPGSRHFACAFVSLGAALRKSYRAKSPWCLSALAPTYLDSFEDWPIPRKAKPGSNVYKAVKDNFTWTCNLCHSVSRGAAITKIGVRKPIMQLQNPCQSRLLPT